MKLVIALFLLKISRFSAIIFPTVPFYSFVACECL
jgi:hypothetical protein